LECNVCLLGAHQTLMAIRQKLIITILIGLCFCGTNARGQQIISSDSYKTDTSSYYHLQVFRQVFWDSLPKPTRWVNDYENLFTEAQQSSLDSIIDDFKNKTSVEICIVTLDTFVTTQEKFDNLALHIANTWGIGDKDKNNGVTICISKGYRRIRVCNGYGIEAYLSNKETQTIVDHNFIPSFKNGNYYEGTINGLMTIIALLNHKMK
jgi:uncharacterized protein